MNIIKTHVSKYQIYQKYKSNKNNNNNNSKNKHSLRSNTKGYDGKTD